MPTNHQIQPFLGLPSLGRLVGYKSIFASKTFWGVAISVASKAILGFELSAELNMQIVDMVILLIGFAGDALALWGRAVAERKVAVMPAKANDELAESLEAAGLQNVRHKL